MNIVLALDGSKESIEAASFLARLPFKDKPSVKVVTALVDTPFELVPADAGLQLREAEKSAARIAFQKIEICLFMPVTKLDQQFKDRVVVLIWRQLAPGKLTL